MEIINSVSICVIVMSVLVIAALCSTEEDNELLNAHRRLVNKHICRHPQPRVFDLAAFNLTGPRDKYIPSQTILHRCECTGSCRDVHMKCRPKRSKPVVLVFRDVSNSHDVEPSFIKVVETNHTSCSCQLDRPR